MNTIRRLLLLAPLALGSLDAAPSHAQLGGAPREHRQGSVAYLSGGIGEEEREAIKAAAASYPLTLELATTGPQRNPYIADARVEIRDTTGRAVLDATAQGPFVLVRLPEGTYTVDVDWNDAEQRRVVQIAPDKHQHLVLEFPRSADR
jgi:hypothetical protein